MAQMLAFFLCLSLLLTGCAGTPPQPTENDGQEIKPAIIDPSRQSPAACYAAFGQAWNAEDYETAFAYLTPQAQQSIVASHAVLVGLWEGMGTTEMHNSDFGQALDAMLAERGVNSVGLLFKAIQDRLVPPGEDDDAYQVPVLFALAKEMGEPLSFISELSRLDRELNERREFLMPLGQMSEATITGPTAEGWFGMPNLSGELSLEFRHTEAGWMIDKLFLYPVNEPGGNQYREALGIR